LVRWSIGRSRLRQIFIPIETKALTALAIQFLADPLRPPRYCGNRSREIAGNKRALASNTAKFGFVGQDNDMATLKQFEANRRNAQKSTGPKTPEGKAAVSMNALRHGLRARTVVLPGENREEFNQLCDDLEVEWHPRSRTEQFYVEQMAVSQWKLTRMEVGEVAIFEDVAASTTKLPLLDRLWQAECRLERSYARAQRELERLQNSRSQTVQQPEEPVPPPQPVAEAPSSAAAAEVGQAFSPVNSAPAAAAPSATAAPEIRHPKSEIHPPNGVESN
jgi:hypothetical protein